MGCKRKAEEDVRTEDGESSNPSNKKIKFDDQDDTEQQIEALELNGCANVFYGNESTQEYGWTCWQRAIKLRALHNIPKSILVQSAKEKIAFKNRSEFQTLKELQELFGDSRRRWKIQAFLIAQRISKKNGWFPSEFCVFNLYQFGLRNWKRRQVTRDSAFEMSLYLFELFGTEDFLQQLVLSPTGSQDVVHFTFTEYFNTLRDPQLNRTELATVFDDLMTSLIFSFAYQAKVRDYAPVEQIEVNPRILIKSKSVKLEEISEVIILILELLLSISKSEAENKGLEQLLENYFIDNENERIKQQPSLLVKVCTSYQGKPNEFDLIKLLLKAGADPNAVDQHGRTPLHLLAKSEHLSSHSWGDPSYSTRAENFTSIVRLILDGRFREGQVDLDGKTALEAIMTLVHENPNAHLCQQLGQMFFVRYMESLRK